jgi:hypothetical protein
VRTKEVNMKGNPFEKAPAFFPFVSAEVFFEAEDQDLNVAELELDDELDAELDAILARA